MRDVHFSFSSAVAAAYPFPRHPSANRNDTKNRLIRAREHDDEETSSHAFPSDNKGLCRLQHQFLFSYALSAKACRGKSNRAERRGRRNGGGREKRDARYLAKVSPTKAVRL